MHYRNNRSDDNVKNNVEDDQYTEEPISYDQQPLCPFCYEQEYSDPQSDSMSRQRRRRRRPMMFHHYHGMPYYQNMPYYQDMPYYQNMPYYNMPYMIHYHYHSHHHYYDR